MGAVGKLLVVCGVILITVGLIIQYFDKLPLIGKLPGDILIERKNFKIYLPISTSVLISILITMILYLIGKFKN